MMIDTSQGLAFNLSYRLHFPRSDRAIGRYGHSTSFCLADPHPIDGIREHCLPLRATTTTTTRPTPLHLGDDGQRDFHRPERLLDILQQQIHGTNVRLSRPGRQDVSTHLAVRAINHPRSGIASRPERARDGPRGGVCAPPVDLDGDHVGADGAVAETRGAAEAVDGFAGEVCAGLEGCREAVAFAVGIRGAELLPSRYEVEGMGARWEQFEEGPVDFLREGLGNGFEAAFVGFGGAAEAGGGVDLAEFEGEEVV